MVNIFIEAKDKKTPESEFLIAILNHLGISSEQYRLIPTNGYANLMNSPDASNINAMIVNTDAGGTNLVVFDADSIEDGGGFVNRREELCNKGKEQGVVFALFLWPNNHDDGDVEVLMESIARKDLYPEFFDCFGKYEHCISKRKNDKGDPFYATPNRKGKLHTYFTSLPISNTKKRKAGEGAWKWDDSNIWDMDAESLTPIKQFLLSYLH